jgi:uncharacterized protein YdeI (YjbR/CyaY-like superfamily)
MPTRTKPVAPRLPDAEAVEIEVLPFASKQAFDAWLSKHHDTPQGIWLRLAKKGSGVPSITYAEAVELALAWGWIDGMSRGEDAVWYRQKFTPRRARSLWSRINRERATAMIAAGGMRAPGLAEVERARQDGRWDAAYEPPSTATVPADLTAALNANRRAQAFFPTLDAQNRYAVLHRIQTAGSPAARARRIVSLVELLAAQKTIHPPRTAATKAAGAKVAAKRPAPHAAKRKEIEGSAERSSTKRSLARQPAAKQSASRRPATRPRAR